MTETTTQNPAEIEREIRDTQDNMSSTIDKIGNQLTIKNIFNSLLDKADENNVDARMLLDGARRNPVALGLIAAGTIWLISDKDAKFPSLNFRSGGTKETKDTQPAYQNDYVAHMSSVQQHSDEDEATYQRRRDIARSNFFMIERGHDEDEGAFRKRLDASTEAFRQKRHDLANRSKEAFGIAQEKASLATYKTKAAFSDNPLIGGIFAAAVGAAVGSALPVSRQEKERLGKIGGQLRDTVASKTGEASEMLRKKKDGLLEKADEALKPSPTAGANTPDENQRSEFETQSSSELV